MILNELVTNCCQNNLKDTEKETIKTMVSDMMNEKSLDTPFVLNDYLMRMLLLVSNPGSWDVIIDKKTFDNQVLDKDKEFEFYSLLLSELKINNIN